jgi:hypothetical protein
LTGKTDRFDWASHDGRLARAAMRCRELS